MRAHASHIMEARGRTRPHTKMQKKPAAINNYSGQQSSACGLLTANCGKQPSALAGIAHWRPESLNICHWHQGLGQCMPTCKRCCAAKTSQCSRQAGHDNDLSDELPQGRGPCAPVSVQPCRTRHVNDPRMGGGRRPLPNCLPVQIQPCALSTRLGQEALNSCSTGANVNVHRGAFACSGANFKRWSIKVLPCLFIPALARWAPPEDLWARRKRHLGPSHTAL